MFHPFGFMSTQAGGDVIPVDTSGLEIYLDASLSSSYPCSGSTWFDITGNGHNLSLINSPTFSSTDGGNIGFVGSSSQYGDFGTKSIISNPFSFQMWVNWKSVDFANKHTYLFSMGYNTNDSYLFHRNTSSPETYSLITVNGGGSIVAQPTTSSSPVAGTWSMVTVTKDSSGNYEIYLDATSIGTLTSVTNVGSGLTYSIGYAVPRNPAYATFNYLNADLGNFALYNRELTSGEVTSNFNATKTRFGL